MVRFLSADFDLTSYICGLDVNGQAAKVRLSLPVSELNVYCGSLGLNETSNNLEVGLFIFTAHLFSEEGQ